MDSALDIGIRLEIGVYVFHIALSGICGPCAGVIVRRSVGVELKMSENLHDRVGNLLLDLFGILVHHVLKVSECQTGYSLGDCGEYAARLKSPDFVFYRSVVIELIYLR